MNTIGTDCSLTGLSTHDLAQSEILKVAKTQLESQGYCIFSTGNTEKSILLDLADCLGYQQGHPESDADGFFEVSKKVSSLKSKTIQEQYPVFLTEEFTPHTDGTFLDGIAKAKEGKFVYVIPPKIVLMQMVQPAISGGSSTILDARQMIEDALLYEPEIVSILLQPHFVFSRDDQCARSPILIRISPDTWSIRWRYDFTILVASEACDALNLFHSKYVCNPKYLKSFALQAGDILVTDNWRVLHGREAFTDDPQKPRLLRRLWVSNYDRVFVNPLNQPQYQRVYAQYQSYSFLDRVRSNPPISISTGIRLQPDCQKIAEKLLSEIF